MIDNGLLEFFKKYADCKGRLKIEDMDMYGLIRRTENFNITKTNVNPVYRYTTAKDYYFGKVITKPKVDAEVLISQLFPKLGLNSAIYVPGINKDHNMAISNNVASSNTLSGLTLFNRMTQENRANLSKDSKEVPLIIPKKIDQNTDFLMKFFTKKGLQKFIEMQVCDVASGNTDRNLGNFFLKLNKYGRADDVITFDHEFSSGITHDKYFLQNNSYVNFINDIEDKNSKEFVEALKNNETAMSVINPNEIAEKIGNVNVDETVKDIKEEINYQIKPEYVESLKISYEFVAEELSK